MMTLPASRDVESLSGLFLDLRPALEEVLRRYEIPPEDACGLLRQAALELIHKGGEMEDPASWLVARLRTSCRRYWVARRRRIATAIGRVFAAC